jgi:hypothetical protein
MSGSEIQVPNDALPSVDKKRQNPFKSNGFEKELIVVDNAKAASKVAQPKRIDFFIKTKFELLINIDSHDIVGL